MTQPTILRPGIGDNPPRATLFYGLTVLDGLRQLPDNSVNAVCTSPPYWSLRNYGVAPQIWGGDPDCAHLWGDEIQGRAQTGGTQNSTLGVTGHSMSPEGLKRTLERSQAEGGVSAFCTRCNAWRGCLGLEPSYQMFVDHIVLIAREIRRVLHPKGTFWLNLGDSYAVAADGDLKAKDLAGIPWRVALALQGDGWWLRNSIVWQKKNALPSSVQDRLSCKYEYVFLLTKEARYFFDLDAIKVRHTSGSYDAEGNFTPNQNWFESGEGHRKMDQEGYLGSLAGSPRRTGRGLFNDRGKNPGDVWKTATGAYAGAHFAVWPEALVERMVKAGTSEGGRCPSCFTPWVRVPSDARKEDDSWEPDCGCEPHVPERCVVLDPFSGSGTTGLVAMSHDRDYVGLDLNAEYLELAEARLMGRKPPQEDQDHLNPIGALFGG